MEINPIISFKSMVGLPRLMHTYTHPQILGIHTYTHRHVVAGGVLAQPVVNTGSHVPPQRMPWHCHPLTEAGRFIQIPVSSQSAQWEAFNGAVVMGMARTGEMSENSMASSKPDAL